LSEPRTFKISIVFAFSCCGKSGQRDNARIAQGQFANRAIEDGDWFDDAIWEDPFGENNTPEEGDGFNQVLIAEGNTVTITDGSASVRDQLNIGGDSGVFGGDGTLEISGGELTAPRVLVSGRDGSTFF